MRKFQLIRKDCILNTLQVKRWPEFGVKKIYSGMLQLTLLAIQCFWVLPTFLSDAILVASLIKTFSTFFFFFY